MIANKNIITMLFYLFVGSPIAESALRNNAMMHYGEGIMIIDRVNNGLGIDLTKEGKERLEYLIKIGAIRASKDRIYGKDVYVLEDSIMESMKDFVKDRRYVREVLDVRKKGDFERLRNKTNMGYVNINNQTDIVFMNGMDNTFAEARDSASLIGRDFLYKQVGAAINQTKGLRKDIKEYNPNGLTISDFINAYMLQEITRGAKSYRESIVSQVVRESLGGEGSKDTMVSKVSKDYIPSVDFRNFSELRGGNGNSGEYIGNRGSGEFRDYGGFRDSGEFRDSIESKTLKEVANYRDFMVTKVLKDSLEGKDNEGSIGSIGFRDTKDSATQTSKFAVAHSRGVRDINNAMVINAYLGLETPLYVLAVGSPIAQKELETTTNAVGAKLVDMVNHPRDPVSGIVNSGERKLSNLDPIIGGTLGGLSAGTMSATIGASVGGAIGLIPGMIIGASVGAGLGAIMGGLGTAGGIGYVNSKKYHTFKYYYQNPKFQLQQMIQNIFIEDALKRINERRFIYEKD